MTKALDCRPEHSRRECVGTSKRPSVRPGMSLVEVIVVMALSFFLMVGTAELLVLALRVQRQARSILDMTDLAAAQMETWRASPPIREGTLSAVGRGHREYALSWTIEPDTPAPSRIELRIFPAGAPHRVLSIPLLFSRELGF